MLGDLYQNDTDAALDNLATLPPERPKPAPKWNGWSAPLRGLAAGASESAAFVADSVKGYGQTMAATGTASAGGMFSIPSDTEQRETEKQRASIAADDVDTDSNLGRSFRNVSRDYRPDAATASTAEKLTFDLTRFVSKAVGYTVAGGGVPGAVMLGADEGMTTGADLATQGVDKTTRTKVGALTGAAAAAGVLLPVAAPGSYLATAGLVAAGGPGAFMAQQAATRSILREANYKELAEAYDPLDPVGLAVSTLVPVGFAGYAVHSAARSSRAQAAIKPIAGDAPPAASAEPGKAAGLTPDETDAVMTHNLTLAQDVREATAPREAAAILRGPQPRDPNQFQTDLATVEIPLQRLQLSADVPQFKGGADVQGVVEPLGGTFDRTGVAPIQVWERLDGTLEVISGRHRRDLAIRSGEATIPGQIHREADGFTAARAAALDAELNIRDGQGKVGDYVQYFQGTGLTRAEADARGLLARSTGQRAFALAADGGPDLIAAHRAGQLSDDAAVAIARAAPGDGRLQAVGQQALQDGKPITQAVNTMHAVRSMMGERADTTGDMFGFDDSAMKEAGRMAALVSRKQRELGESLAAVQGASKRPELAKREGVNIKDPEALQQRITELQTERAAWDNWSTNANRVAQIRDELGLTPLKAPEGMTMEPGLARMYEQAGAVKPVFDGRLMEVADRLGAQLKLAKLKGPDRAAAKIASDYGGDPTQIKDLVRGTVVVKSLQDVEQAIAELRNKFEVLETGFRNSLTDATVSPNGYRDVKMNVRIDGHTAEVQVNLAEMMAAKHDAHPLYEQQSALARKISDEQRLPTQAERNEAEALQQRQRDIYTAAWAEANSSRNLDSGTSTPLRMAESQGKERGSNLSQAVATSPDSMVMGIPSTSMNSVPAGKDSGSSGGSFMSMVDILPEGGLFGNELPPVHKDPLTRSVLGRVAELERIAPDMVVGKDANGNDVTVRQEMDRIRRESFEGTDAELGARDADLLEVAANCALTLGAGA
ncbi:MAG: RelA/SpoT domain-containing protein [Burkholderiaceae bacterium]|nr:RelA/SpoT domain-containing protein [Burkholderiaceae bacterium]